MLDLLAYLLTCLLEHTYLGERWRETLEEERYLRLRLRKHGIAIGVCVCAAVLRQHAGHTEGMCALLDVLEV